LWRGPWTRQSGDDAHGTAAAGATVNIDAHEVAQALAVIACSADRFWRLLIEKPADQGELGDAVAVGEEAVMPDAVEAVGQAVQQKAANELIGVERHHLGLVVLAVGGPLSPLLSNLVLDDLDKELTRRGHRFCRYADDCNIYVRSRRAGERVMASVSRFLTRKLRLKVNRAKSAVARPEKRQFLGFSISNDGGERRIAPHALTRFKTRIREITRRTRGLSLAQLIEELAPYLIGWRGYFGFCQTPRVLTNLGAWIRRRLRMYLWRQWQNGHNRFKELRRRGVPKFNAAVAAGSPTGYWRMSGHPAVQMALRNHVFDSLGLPRLHVSAQA